MLINNLIYECDERYSQNKDGCQCDIVNVRFVTKVIVLNA